MSLFDSFGRVLGEVAEAATETTEALAEGDFEGAADAVADGARETAEAVEDGFNDAGEAASAATGGGLQFSANNGTFNVAVEGADLGFRTTIDADASDGEIGHSSDGYVTVDGAQRGVTDSGSADAEGVTHDTGVYTDDGSVRDETGVTVGLHAEDGQIGADAGVYEETDGDGEPVTRSEAGLTVNLDATIADGLTKGSIDLAGYDERSQGEVQTRTEAGVTAGVGVATDDDGGWQAGVDSGVFEEDSSTRREVGVTANLDYDPGSGGQLGVDTGVYEEETTSSGSHLRNEIGTTLNVDVQQSRDAFQIGLDAGVYTELDEDRTEIGTTANVGISSDDAGGVQLGADAGVYAENEADERGEVTATANLDLQVSEDNTGFQIGGDVGVAAEKFDETHTRSEAGVTANLGGSGYGDEGFQFGVDGGVYAETDAERGEAGVTANLDIEGDEDGIQIGVDAGVQAEHYGETHERGEAGLDVQVDVQTYDREGIGEEFQFGVDAGVFAEHEGERAEVGLTANADVSAASQQFGLDGGGYVETISGGSESTRHEGGATVNMDLEYGPESTGGGIGDQQFGLDVGLFGERTIDGQDDVRVEVGATANVDQHAEQGSYDLGLFVDIDEVSTLTSDDDGMEGGRLEVGLTINGDVDGNIDAGVFRESRHRGDTFISTNPTEGIIDDGGSHRVEGGVTVGLTDGGLDAGVFVEGYEAGDQEGRSEDGIHIQPTDDGLVASGYLERTGSQGNARWDNEAEEYVSRGETEIGEINFGQGSDSSSLTVADEPGPVESTPLQDPAAPAELSDPVIERPSLEADTAFGAGQPTIEAAALREPDHELTRRRRPEKGPKDQSDEHENRGKGHKKADVELEIEEVIVELVPIDDQPDFDIIELPEIPEIVDFDEVDQPGLAADPVVREMEMTD